jgi:hypothetical protein
MHGMKFKFGGFLKGIFGLGEFFGFDFRDYGNFLVHIDFKQKSRVADCVNAVVGCFYLLNYIFYRKLYVSWCFVEIALTKKSHNVNFIAHCQEHTRCESTFHFFDKLIFYSNFRKLRYEGLIQNLALTIESSCVIHFVEVGQ